MNVVQNSSKYAKSSALNIAVDALSKDGALCNAMAKEYDEQGTYEGGSGLRKLFKETNDKITRYHTLLKVLTGEQRANISEAIPVIDFLRPENTSFRYTYATYPNSANTIDPSSIIEIPYDSRKTSLNYIEENDPYIINRALLGEPVAEHFFGTTSLVGPQYNVQAGLYDESLTRWMYFGAWRNSDFLDLTDVISTENMQSFEITFDTEIFLETVRLPEVERAKDNDLSGTEYSNLVITRFNSDKDLRSFTYFDNGIESSFIQQGIDEEGENLGYVAALRPNDIIVVLKDYLFNLADYKVIVFKYQDIQEEGTDIFSHNYKAFIFYVRRMKSFLSLDEIPTETELPEYLERDEIRQYLIPYCKLEKWYFGESSGLLNGLYCEPYEWTEGIPQDKKISSRNITKWKYCNEVEEAQARGEKITVGSRYFPGHLLHRGTIKVSPLKLTAHDPKYKLENLEDGSLQYLTEEDYQQLSDADKARAIAYKGKAEVFFDKIVSNDLISSFFNTITERDWHEERNPLGNIVTFDDFKDLSATKLVYPEKFKNSDFAKDVNISAFEDYINSFFTLIEQKVDSNGLLDLSGNNFLATRYFSSWEGWTETVHHETKASDGHIGKWDETINHSGLSNLSFGDAEDILKKRIDKTFHIEYQNDFPSCVQKAIDTQRAPRFPAYGGPGSESDSWYCRNLKLNIITPLDVFRKKEGAGIGTLLLYTETEKNFPRECYLLSDREIPLAVQMEDGKEKYSLLSFVDEKNHLLSFKVNDVREYHRSNIKKVKFEHTGEIEFLVTRDAQSPNPELSKLAIQLSELQRDYPLDILENTYSTKTIFGFGDLFFKAICQKYGIDYDEAIKAHDQYQNALSRFKYLGGNIAYLSEYGEYASDVYCYSLSPIVLAQTDIELYDWNDNPLKKSLTRTELIPANYPSDSYFPVIKRKNIQTQEIKYIIKEGYQDESFKILKNSQIVGGCPKFRNFEALNCIDGIFAPTLSRYLKASLGKDIAAVNLFLSNILRELLVSWPLSDERTTSNPILLSDLPELLEGLQEVRAPLARLAYSGLELPVNTTSASDYPETLNLGDLTRLLMRYDTDLIRSSAISSISLDRNNIDISGDAWKNLHLSFKKIEEDETRVYVSLYESDIAPKVDPGETPEGFIALGIYGEDEFQHVTVDDWNTGKTAIELFSENGVNIDLSSLWESGLCATFNKIFGLILRRAITRAVTTASSAPTSEDSKIRSFQYIYNTAGQAILNGKLTQETCQALDSVFGNDTLPFINITQTSCTVPVDSATDRDKKLISSYTSLVVYYVLRDFFLSTKSISVPVGSTVIDYTYADFIKELYSFYFYDGADVVNYIDEKTHDVTKTDFKINFFADSEESLAGLTHLDILQYLPTAATLIAAIRDESFSKEAIFKDMPLERLQINLNNYYYTHIVADSSKIIESSDSIPEKNTSLGNLYQSFIDIYEKKLYYDTEARMLRDDNGYLINNALRIISSFGAPDFSLFVDYFSGSPQSFSGWAKAYVKTTDTTWQSFESSEGIVYKKYYALLNTGYEEVSFIEEANPKEEGWYETARVLKPSGEDEEAVLDTTNFYYYPSISWQDESPTSGASSFEKDENGCLLTDLTILLPGIYPSLGESTAILGPTWDKRSDNLDASSFYRVRLSIPDATGDIDASEPLLEAIADFARKALEGKDDGSIAYPLRMLESDDVATGRENSLYFKRYQFLNNRMNRLTGPLFEAARLFRNTEILADISNINESTVESLQSQIKVLPVSRIEPLAYIPTQEATSTTVSLDGRFYYQAEMDAIRERISGKCILTCTHCSEKEHCPFYNEEEVLKMYCTPAETIDIYVKDNKLDMIYYDDNPTAISPDIYEYEDVVENGNYIKKRVGESISSEVFKELHQPYSEILSKTRKIRDDLSEREGSSESYADLYRPLTGTVKNESDILPSVEYELLSNSQLGWNKNINGGLGWLSGARYGTVEVNDSADMLNKQFVGLDVSPYRFLYDALFIADEETEIAYVPSDFYDVEKIDIVTQDKKLHRYGGRTKIWLPATLKILAEADPDDDVYLVSDDIRDSNGARISPVIYLDTVKALWSRITFGIDKSSKAGIQSADDNKLYAQDIAQWSANCCKNHNVYNPGGVSNTASGTSIWSNRDQYWMPEIYKRVEGRDEDGTSKYIAVPGRLRESSGYQEVLLDADNLDRNQVLAGHPAVAEYINFLRRVSIRLCEANKEDPSQIKWLVKWIKDLPTPLTERDKARIEEKRRILSLMKTNLRLAVIHNS